MADVFISYKREERDRVEAIAERLRGLGLSVWFDSRLSAGESFDEEINREVRAARCVLVCWSPGAVASQWVRAEAGIGRERDVLCAVMLERAQLMPPYNVIHTADLTKWRGEDAHPGWLATLARIGQLTERPDLVARGAQYLPSEPQRPLKSRSWRFWAVAAALVLVLGAGGTFAWRALGLSSVALARYDIYFDGSAQGLQVGDPVRFSGVQVGEVAWVGLNAEDAARAVAFVHIDPHVPVREDSVAAITPFGDTGRMVLEISPGSQNSSPLRYVEGQRAPRISESREYAREIQRRDVAEETLPFGRYVLSSGGGFDLDRVIAADEGADLRYQNGSVTISRGVLVEAETAPASCVDRLAAVDVDASPLVLGSGWACVKTDLGRVASLRFEPDGTSMIIYYSFAP